MKKISKDDIFFIGIKIIGLCFGLWVLVEFVKTFLYWGF